MKELWRYFKIPNLVFTVYTSDNCLSCKLYKVSVHSFLLHNKFHVQRPLSTEKYREVLLSLIIFTSIYNFFKPNTNLWQQSLELLPLNIIINLLDSVEHLLL